MIITKQYIISSKLQEKKLAKKKIFQEIYICTFKVFTCKPKTTVVDKKILGENPKGEPLTYFANKILTE